MIKKIKILKNIGSFLYFDWDSVNPSLQIDANCNPVLDKKGDQKIISNQFNKFNVLFGENGTGKTTIVNLFKTLNEDSNSLINKNWDHEADPFFFEFETDSTNILFSDRYPKS
ncbi:MAG: hypothetical protein C3F02_05025 [Parcubacteria group bacterium]|nr:MAG: hypothetical protein C3F02_05025 [Parcubacteria group bacterium]